MKVHIAGGDGQLGVCVAAALQKLHWVELLVTNKQALDITDDLQVQLFISANKPDVVINAAAFTSVDDAEHKIFEVDKINHWGAASLAKATAEIGAVLIQVSTDYVFSGDQSQPYTENDAANPLNVYGKTKLDGERAIARLNYRHVILRTSWLFSEGGKSFYSTMRRLLATKNRISVVNDQIGAPTYAPDIAQLIVKVIERLSQQNQIEWGIYHYSGYPFVSWFDFARQIQIAFGLLDNKCDVMGVSSAVYNSLAKRPLYSCLNSSKTCNYFDIKPSNWLAALNQLAINDKASNENN